MSNELKFTGERFHPDKGGEMWFEHWHRYHIAAQWVKGKRVLDIACGEGYGARRLSEFAANVVGVDISPDAVEHARTTYGENSRLRFLPGSCTAIPLEASSVDVVVSFETLEHIGEHDAFLSEIKRVLVPAGLAIISTPNKAEYSDARGYVNEFHIKELYFAEFDALLKKHFLAARYLTQRNGFHSLVQPMNVVAREGELTIESMPANAANTPAPLYYIALVSDDQHQLDVLDLTASVFTAHEDNQVGVFMQIWQHSQHLEGKVADLQREIEVLRAAAPAATAPIVATGKPESWLERTIKRLSK